MKVIQNQEIAWQIYDGEAVLVDPEGSLCRVLNETATRIWDICADPCTIDEINETLHKEYEADIDQLRNDIKSIVAEFIEKRLLLEIAEND